MALTLPYPNMDFTPLDILTADEMDQLVANIEYIATLFPMETKKKTLWNGTLSDTTSSIHLNEAMKNNVLYIATFKALSGDYTCSFPFWGGTGTQYRQFYMSDGTNYVRWRMSISGTTVKLPVITTNTSLPQNYTLLDISKPMPNE